MSIPQKKIILFLVLLTISCYNFNQTRKVSKKIKGIEDIEILNILSASKLETNEIKIVASIKYKENNQPENTKCILIVYNSYFEEFKFKKYIENKAIFEDCPDTKSLHSIQYEFEKPSRKISKNKYKSIDKIEKNTNNKNTFKLIIELEYDHIILNLDQNYDILNRFSKYPPDYNKPAIIQSKPTFYLLYPFSITYDLFSGTLHTIAMPIMYVCGIGLSKALQTNPSNLENLITMPLIYTTCPVSKLLIYPDGYKIISD
ncbi:hypothetical protein AB3N62_11195 [Leptospira sp. WS4.C2]